MTAPSDGLDGDPGTGSDAEPVHGTRPRLERVQVQPAPPTPGPSRSHRVAAVLAGRRRAAAAICLVAVLAAGAAAWGATSPGESSSASAGTVPDTTPAVTVAPATTVAATTTAAPPATTATPPSTAAPAPSAVVGPTTAAPVTTSAPSTSRAPAPTTAPTTSATPPATAPPPPTTTAPPRPAGPTITFLAQSSPHVLPAQPLPVRFRVEGLRPLRSATVELLDGRGKVVAKTSGPTANAGDMARAGLLYRIDGDARAGTYDAWVRTPVSRNGATYQLRISVVDDERRSTSVIAGSVTTAGRPDASDRDDDEGDD